ncbi:MAG: M28 family peptidase [Alteraurantiacibacter sp.]
MPNRLTATLLGAVAMLVVPAAATANTAPESANVNRATLERDTAVLAADNMEGREAGTRGHERAAGYVAGRFASLGLEPAGDDGTYFQNVTLRSYAPAAEGNSLSIEGMDDLATLEDFYVLGSPIQQSGTIEAPLVFIGYGLDIPGRDDFANVDLEGAVAVRIYGGPENLDGEEASHLRSTIDERLSERGAVGMLLLRTPQLEERFNWEHTAQSVQDRRSMTWVGPDGVAYTGADNLLVSTGISPALSRELFEGQDFDYDDIVAAEDTEDALMPSFALNRTIRITFASDFEDVNSPNVIGMLPGSDPEVADEYVILTAHLDHVGIQPTEEEGDDEIYNGALDNAVGVASMMEVGRLLKETPARRPVLLVALTAEEKGLLGSAYNAQNPTVPADQIVANVNLDMPVATYDFADVVAFGAERSTLYPQVEAAAQEYGLMLSPDPQPEQGFFTRSDQYSYVRRSIPAVYLDLGFANGGEEAQGIVYEEHYHEPSDEIDLIDFSALERFTGVNYAIARNIANMEKTPAWYPGDFFGTTFNGRIVEED